MAKGDVISQFVPRFVESDSTILIETGNAEIENSVGQRTSTKAAACFMITLAFLQPSYGAGQTLL